MSYGSTAKVLRVNLTTGLIRTEELSEDFYRLYPGGKALAGYYLLNETPAHTDPFAPENVMVVANGLLTGSPVSTATRYVVSARSPLTNAYGESEAGGFWGPELKMAGFEALIITGAAPDPVYLWIQDGVAELRSAAQLWGRDPLYVQTAIQQELGDDKIRVMPGLVEGLNAGGILPTRNFRQEDSLPERMFAPLENGPLLGQSLPRAEFEESLTLLYELKGWDIDTTQPTRARLEALSLGWVADLLEQ